MSRRESRSSIGPRQNDALFEFENFKKKFLLANKHITKLNSTLSVRIEELNAQISLLNVENLRLRASEIALAAQLKREREKSERVIADAEAASQSLIKHLSYLRDSYDIKPTRPTHPIPSSPRARRREPSVDPDSGSPLFLRVARPPNVPGIHEEDEPSSDEQQHHASPISKKTKSKPRLSASKLPLPTRSTSPTRAATPMVGHQNTEHLSASLHTSKPRKTLRRPSGLLEINTEALSVPRSASPAFGSPIRLEAGRAEEAEEYAAIHGEIGVVILDQNEDNDAIFKRDRRKGKSKELRESGSERDGSGDVRPRERTKHRDEVEPSDLVKLKSRDSSITRTALQPIDSNVYDPADVEPAKHPNRQFLRPSSPVGSAPTSRGSSSPAPPDGDGSTTGNRERRTRKSVNYAEPKLNTKMRKPDPPPGGIEAPARKKRSSAAAVMSSSLYKPLPSPSTNAMDNDTDVEPRSSLEGPALAPLVSLPLRGTNGYINPEDFPIPVPRPGSAAAMYSPGPPTRTTGSTTSGASTSSGTSSSVTTLKKKKSRPQLSDDESDGGEADAEYVGGGSGATGSWVNVEGRRKALPKRSAAAAAVAAIEDIRRHSMVI
ncbi:hypothetical protein HYPSUDRAFT_72222 [Hypholoma sublateritium FD-334 SS-4]|uniref:Shugoshin C-terminal domain-containing protein n=1 Tax=Hypholoma sublateritium (strain FD-334 SS-4) TaxID=945553 RepID=A0A0D2N801_HYPSF|nr:hypothetical protein HYPSUDRAFT_72222 [Hypholoma sublateritium FD-334 SS-4]